MVLIYPDTLSTFHGDREIAMKNGYVEIEDSLYQDLLDTKKMWQNGEIVDDPSYPARKEKQDREDARQEIINQINHYKSLLSESDYIAIKHSEGWISDEEFAETKALRQSYRDEINRLEKELDK